jgi:adenylate cyclase
MASLSHKEEVSVLEKEEIQKNLQKILDSPDFRATQSQRNFLLFVVKETLAGRSHEIKGYTVGTKVFGRKADFDPNTDPIVSIQANQLRRALERYYLTAGARDVLRIDIPKGTYVPAFYTQTESDAGEAHQETVKGTQPEAAWPTILIRPFENLTEDPQRDFFGFGLSTELAVEIARFQELRVLIQNAEDHIAVPADSVARFIIDGNIRQGRSKITVTVTLTDVLKGKHIWGDTLTCGREASCLIEFQEHVARVVATKVTGEGGVITRAISRESKNKPPSKLKTYEAILRYYAYNQTLTQDSFLRALEALQHAAEKEPECGQVWSMLGHLYSNIYSLEIPGFEGPLEKAMNFAQNGALLTPDNQRARGILAYVLMLADEIPAALAEIERALALNPNSLFMLDGIGYLLTLLGEWERGPALIRKIMQLNPYYGLYVHYALWEDWVRRKEYSRAYLETINFRRPAVFWEPLMKAATLGLLGRIQEGKQTAKALLTLKPDFPKRGRALIRHYIKFDDIVERIVYGLMQVGVDAK